MGFLISLLSSLSATNVVLEELEFDKLEGTVVTDDEEGGNVS